MSYPADLKYTKSHEWIRLDGTSIVVGISWFAQDSMGDVVHVELPEVGSNVERGEPACEIESVKAVSDVYAPVSGEVVLHITSADGSAEREVHLQVTRPSCSRWVPINNLPDLVHIFIFILVFGAREPTGAPGSLGIGFGSKNAPE